MLALQIAAILLTAVAMALSLAHALELPGKRRLGREEYLTVQRIYYPGFTLGGAAEPLGIVVLAALLALSPVDTTRFWLIAGALAALAAEHAIFWVMTQPVNRYWLKEQRLSGAADAFFQTGRGLPEDAQDWARMRDRWERSHVLRAIAATLALTLLAAALAI